MRQLPLRMDRVQSPIIPVVAEMIKNRPGTISLGQGVVYYGPPPETMEEIKSFWSDPINHKYQSVQGIPPLLEAIGSKLRLENGIGTGEENAIVVTAGGNMAFMNAILAIADAGDEIILQSPYYFNHEMAVQIAGCSPVLVETDAEYQLRVEAIGRAITPRTRAVVTISPNNPAGAVYPEAALRSVNQLCLERGIYHIHDEAYEYFTYDGVPHFSPASIPGAAGHTVSLFSLSKAYGFASWRIGYMVIPEFLLGSVKKIQDTLLICPPVISQFAALGALRAGVAYCHARRRTIETVRATLVRELRQLEGRCVTPPAQGAFYFLLRLKTELEPLRLVEQLVQRHRVAAIPGIAFGMRHGCNLRVAYGALEEETALDGIERLVRGLRDLVS